MIIDDYSKHGFRWLRWNLNHENRRIGVNIPDIYYIYIYMYICMYIYIYVCIYDYD